MSQKLTFVNGAKAACGCRHEFSSGGGEYSDVAYVHLCGKHAGAPVLDDRWKARMLDGRAPERDEMGLGDHPELPLLDEGMMPRSFFAALGLELAHTSAEDQLDGDVLGAMSEAVNWSRWMPTAPKGDGWKLVSIFDTEDGPVAWWLRELPEAEDGTTTIRILQAEVEKLKARIARAGAAPAAVLDVHAIAAAVCQRVAELPDRDSPEDWPEAMLVTGPELIDAVADEIEQALAQAAPALEAPAAAGLTDGQLDDESYRVNDEPGYSDAFRAGARFAERVHGLTAAAARAVTGKADWWRGRADEIEAQVARSGSSEAMRCYTDMRTLLQAAAAPQAPNCTRCSGSGEDPEGYLTHGRGPDNHTVDGPCRSCDGTGAAPQAPAAPSGLPSGWVPCILTHDGQHPEEVAYGPQIMMDRLKKWLGRYFELLAQKVLAEPVHAEMLAALQAVGLDVVHVGAGENAISDAARAKVEAVLEKIGAPWPGPAAAPAAPSAIATQVIENMLQLARIVNTAVEDWGESFEDGSMEVTFHKEEADAMEAILEFFDSLPDAPPEEGVIESGPLRAARVLRALAAPAAPAVDAPAQVARDAGFNHGVCLALQIMASAGNAGSAEWIELLDCAGRDEIMHYAQHVETENWLLCGFAAVAAQAKEGGAA